MIKRFESGLQATPVTGQRVAKRSRFRVPADPPVPSMLAATASRPSGLQETPGNAESGNRSWSLPG